MHASCSEAASGRVGWGGGYFNLNSWDFERLGCTSQISGQVRDLEIKFSTCQDASGRFEESSKVEIISIYIDSANLPNLFSIQNF